MEKRYLRWKWKNIAQEFEEIRECACIGVDDPDGILGKVPVLYIVPEGSAVNEEELTKFLAERMERYKLPQRYLNIRELPRNRMKKLDRKALYRRWEENGDQQMVNEVVQNILSRRSIRDFTEEQVPKSCSGRRFCSAAIMRQADIICRPGSLP